jgi:hypothetical protein
MKKKYTVCIILNMQCMMSVCPSSKTSTLLDKERHQSRTNHQKDCYYCNNNNNNDTNNQKIQQYLQGFVVTTNIAFVICFQSKGVDIQVQRTSVGLSKTKRRNAHQEQYNHVDQG